MRREQALVALITACGVANHDWQIHQASIEQFFSHWPRPTTLYLYTYTKSYECSYPDSGVLWNCSNTAPLLNTHLCYKMDLAFWWLGMQDIGRSAASVYNWLKFDAKSCSSRFSNEVMGPPSTPHRSRLGSFWSLVQVGLWSGLSVKIWC